MLDFNDAEGQRSGFSGELIPEGSVAIVVATLRPGGNGPDGTLRHSDTGASMLDFEFTIQGGDYDRRKIWNLYVVDGVTEGHEKAKNISKSALRAMLESARNIMPDDTSDAAMAARKIASYSELDGLVFPVEIGVKKGDLRDKTAGPNSERYADKNIIRTIITPDMEEYSNPGASNGGAKPSASKPSTPSAQSSAGKPSWAQ